MIKHGVVCVPYRPRHNEDGTTQENLPFYLDNLAALLSEKIARGNPTEEVTIAYEQFMARSGLGFEVRENFHNRVSIYLDRLSAAGMISSEMAVSHWILRNLTEVRPASP
ncbi:hypothetical protein OHA02_51170 [Streptomyces phaeochromogenes]|nr:hypothetical protein [Streptomyces phaeochromogenes]